MSMVMPDVCLTPAAPSPIPIPYPNIGQASDTSQGPTTVTTDGQMPMVKGRTVCQIVQGDDAPARWAECFPAWNMQVCEFLMVFLRREV